MIRGLAAVSTGGELLFPGLNEGVGASLPGLTMVDNLDIPAADPRCADPKNVVKEEVCCGVGDL